MPCGQHACGHPTLDGDRQAQQPDHVGDHRPRPADPAGQLLVGDPELVEQLLIGGRLLQGVQLCPMDVLEQSVAQQVVIGGLAHDGRDGRQPGLLRRPPAALPHDQLVAPRTGGVGDLPDHHGLHQPELPDRVHQLRQGVLVEHLPGLAGIGFDGGGVDLPVHRADVLRGGARAADHDIRGGLAHPRTAVRRSGRNQGCQAAA